MTEFNMEDALAVRFAEGREEGIVSKFALSSASLRLGVNSSLIIPRTVPYPPANSLCHKHLQFV